MDLTRYSKRKLQAYGALCLAAFTSTNNIYHPAIDERMAHWLALLISNNLPDWEQHGATLHLSGRGDPIPDDLVAVIPSALRGDFERLVQYVEEIGLVDMYGADSWEPVRFMREVEDLLHRNGIALPDLSRLLTPDLYGPQPASIWGEPVSTETYNEVCATCRALVCPR